MHYKNKILYKPLYKNSKNNKLVNKIKQPLPLNTKSYILASS